jgi:multiple sugar transport system substrate-binding protein
MPAMERGFIRPRYNGYLFFQDHSGEPIQHYLLNGGDEKEVLKEINELYKRSLSSNKLSVYHE